MPLITGKDTQGCFIKYGDQGTKYHYECGNETQRNQAKKKAIAQAVAIGEFAEQSYTDYPQQATDNAKAALRWVEKNGWGDCGTPVGKVRANQLANREPISRETIARMAAFERHRQNSNKEFGDGCGRLMWQAWGGDAGIEWAQRKLQQIDKEKLSMGEDRISFDYDEVLTRSKIQDVAKEYLDNDVAVYVISARHNAGPIYNVTDKLGIPRQRVYVTGSNKAKLEKILELGITKHYDNNEKVINELGNIGELVQLTIHERFAALIKFISNDQTGTRN